MRLATTAHASRPWRIHEIAGDFTVEDVWALPTPGGPDDLRAWPHGPDLRAAPFTAIYQTHDEWAAEPANRTVHTVMHLGWVPDPAGGHRGQTAVPVKPNGRFGAVYPAGVKPFRYLGVHPALLRMIGRGWRAGDA
ncbi:DUF2867 domain-containing protein [Streptosporangium sp. NPDC051022]|uniref:DUF2867 domain-containing protein n=1 Tax=Streptosporangium sp. NPDC051022 TaxID=3155752 RepID=UPI0034131C28